MRKPRLLAAILSALLVLGGAVLLAQPKRNVSPGRHPHIARAQQLSQQAFQQISDAQQANEWDMQGHAAKAKELLDQVNNQLRQAATAANNNSK
ncbi:MAG TPA: hypothetical protein VKS01_11930 [Bryobacteraceae bacterium]|nr:hypothetical protein [Bryobacteraceae bacterium]